jgi:eukaryotic-like serine/threonine-protein kinase
VIGRRADWPGKVCRGRAATLGHEGMKQREAKIPAQGKVRLTEALGRLVQLYQATGKKDKAAEWRRRLESTKATPKPQAKP